MSTAAWKGFAVIPPAYRRVLLSAWQARRNRGSMWFLGVVGLLFASLPILVWWFTHQQTLQFTMIATAAVTIVFLVAAWSMLAFNVLLQNHPHTARLLPAQVPVLRNTLCATAALICAVATLLSWLAGGPVLGVAASMALGLAGLALSQRWFWLWILFFVLIWALPNLGARGELSGVPALWRSAPEALTLLALVLSALGLRAVVMTGNARHERAHARLLKLGAAMRGQVPGTSEQAFGGPASWTMKAGKNIYGTWMNHVLTRAQPKLGARLALGLGPQAHWTGLVAGQTMGVVFVVLILLAVLLYPNWELGHNMVGGMMFGPVIACLAATVVQIPAAMWASRREQSLLRLLPGVPQGVLLNRWLATRLARVHLAVLTVPGLTVLVLSNFEISYVFSSHALELALSGLALTVSLGFALWRNWAATKAPAGSAQGLLMLAMLLVGGLSAAWVLWFDRPWYQLAALTLLLMLPLGWWRWRVISRAPAAWPVGRLG